MLKAIKNYLTEAFKNYTEFCAKYHVYMMR